MKKVFSTLALVAASLVILSLSPSNAYADGIVFIGSDPLHADGVGLRTVLSLQSPGRSTTESGGIAFTSSGDLLFGDATRGGTNNTVAVSELGLTSTNAQVLIGLDVNEPSGGAGSDPITVNNIILRAYDQNGNEVFSASLLQSQTLSLLGNGQGTADYVFGLDDAAAARLAAAIAANPNLRLGLEATITHADGGPESFYLNVGRGGAPVPEPTTMVLLGTGLAGLAARLRKRRKAAQTEE